MDSESDLSLRASAASSSDWNGPAWVTSFGKSSSSPSLAPSSPSTGPRPIDPSPTFERRGEQLSLLSISSAEDFPAKTSRTPARAKASTARVRDFGVSSHELLASYDPASSSWKTSQRSLLGGWSVYSETFPSSGTMRGGQLFAQVTWVPHIAANGSSSWPTPCARDEKGPYTNHRQGGRDLSSEITKWPTPIASDANGPRAEDGKRSTGLNTQALREWPTPTAHGLGGNTDRDGKKRHGQDSTVTLTEAVRSWPTPRAADGDSGMEHFFRGSENPTLLGAVREHWPTPTAGDGKSAGSRNLPGSAAHAGVSLTDAVIHGGSRTPRAWPTPRAEDSESSGAHRGVPDTLTSAVRSWPTPSATPYGRQKTGSAGAAVRPSLETQARKTGMQLNPTWVEALMGFPCGWTDGLPVPAKSKKRGSRRARSRAKRTATEGRD